MIRLFFHSEETSSLASLGGSSSLHQVARQSTSENPEADK